MEWQWSWLWFNGGGLGFNGGDCRGVRVAVVVCLFFTMMVGDVVVCSLVMIDVAGNKNKIKRIQGRSRYIETRESFLLFFCPLVFNKYMWLTFGVNVSRHMGPHCPYRHFNRFVNGMVHM